MAGDDQIIAAVVTEESRDKVDGEILILLAEDAKQVQEVALSLSRITRAMIHELPTGVVLLVRH